MTKVLTQEEIETLKTIQEKRFKLIEQFGIIETKIQEFTLQKSQLITNLQQLRQEETQIGESLQQKYGDGTINLEKGEFLNADSQ